MSRRFWIEEYLERQQHVIRSLILNMNPIEDAIDILERTRRSGKRIFVAGNGGSLANASHFAQDLGKGSSDALQKISSGYSRFKAAALDNSSWITALGNDYDYDRIFVDQLKTVAEADDVFIGISVSGTSTNIVRAMEWADSNGLITIALTGNQPAGKKSSIAHRAGVVIRLDDNHFGRVEDSMMTVLHMLSYYFIDREV